MRFNWVFFFQEIGRLDDWAAEQIAESGFEAEEIEAGVQLLNSAFGIYATVDMISKHTRVSEDDLMKWSYYRFYYKVAYLSHVNDYQKRLREEYKKSK